MPTQQNPADRPANPLHNVQNNSAFTGINGVPLGGIGAGCLEIIPDGRLANFCTNNNRHRNERIEKMPGSFLAFAASDGERQEMRLLQTSTDLPCGAVQEQYLLSAEDISYTGLYPKANIQYSPGIFPLEIALRASGTVIPGDLRASSMPAALFTFDIRNTSPRAAWGSVIFSWENIAGCLHGIFPDGRDDIRAVAKDGRLHGLTFHSPENCRLNQRGSHALFVDAPAQAEISAARYNSWESSSIICRLADHGTFDAESWTPSFFSESRFIGALAAKVMLQPGESTTITFALAWYYPDYAVSETGIGGSTSAPADDQGHQYSNYFSTVNEVAEAALAEHAEISHAITNWHASLLNSSLPEWLSSMLINNLYVLSPGTLWAKDGRYSLMETPYGPMMGTLDQRFYSSIASALFFPELEKEELSLFAITQHPADRGRVYHDLGNLRFDDPKTGTTAKRWTDLNPKFVLMAYRNYLWINDRAELERLWPYMCEMMAYTLSQDSDADGLPNNEDRSTTYDDWAFFGANSYSSSLWVAALAAFREMSELLNRENDWQPYAEIYLQATESFEARLWDEELGYYRLYNDDLNTVFTDENAAQAATSAVVSLANAAVNQGDVPLEAMNDHPPINRDCHDGQLAGQWYADLLGMGKLFREERILSAVQQIFRRNATEHGVRKGVNPQGGESPNPPSSRWWSEAGQSWPGYEVGHYAALAIYQGEVADALTTVERLYRDIHLNANLAWNQPLRWNVESAGTYGWGCDRYMNSPAIWFVYLALVGVTIDRPRQALALRPNLWNGCEKADLPLFLPANQGRLQLDKTSYQISFTHPEPIKSITVPAGDYQQVEIAGTDTPYTIEAKNYGSKAEWLITFAETVNIGQNPLTILTAKSAKAAK